MLLCHILFGRTYDMQTGCLLSSISWNRSYFFSCFSSLAKARVGRERGCQVGMGRHPEYLGSSLIRLIMVRLYDQSNIAFAHDYPILFGCPRQDRTHMSFGRLPMVKSGLSRAGARILWSRKVSNMMGVDWT